MHLFAEVAPRRVQAEIELPRQAAQHLHVIGAGRVRPRPRHDRALPDRQRLVGDDHGVEQHLLAEPVAARARPCGALNENNRGSISAMVKPDTGHANFSEKVIRPRRRIVGKHRASRLFFRLGPLMRRLQRRRDADIRRRTLRIGRFRRRRVRPLDLVLELGRHHERSPGLAALSSPERGGGPVK